ncbi:glycosyltransferase [Candidatus Woesebacteria bacterium]|nr:glycosyltransferase [Candidatus Woesebacteria bacterium]
MRKYDFNTAQGINFWIANSKNVQERINRYYKKDSTVIYPPVEVNKIVRLTKGLKKKNYYLIVSRLVGAKGLEDAASAVKSLGVDLWIAGETSGFTDIENKLSKLSGGKIKFLGRLPDAGLYRVLGEAKGFIALARDEDFGMTVVEAQAAGTPVIAFNGGGFKESVTDGLTGILVENTDEKTLTSAFKRFEKIRWDKAVLVKNVERFSRERFEKEMQNYVERVLNDKK